MKKDKVKRIKVTTDAQGVETVTEELVDQLRVFTPTELATVRRIPVTSANVYPANPGDPDEFRYYMGIPITIQPGQLQPDEYVSITIWETLPDGTSRWVEHTAWEPNTTATSTFVFKWYAPNSRGQYYYTYVGYPVIAKKQP